MKKLFLLPLIAISFSANAETISMPASMASNPTPLKVQPQQTKAEAEVNGYSVAFLAYHFNTECNLGLPKIIIDNLASELQAAEAANQISKADIDSTVAEAKKVFTEDKAKFCADATKVADTIKGLFGVQ